MNFLKNTEFLALIMSLSILVSTVWLAHKGWKKHLNKEIFFKKQKIAERIIAKLINLESDFLRFKYDFEGKYKENTNENFKYLKSINASNIAEEFTKDSQEIAALIEIYFGELTMNWNECCNCMSEIATQMCILDHRIESEEQVNWKEEKDNFNKWSLELGTKPKEIIDSIKEDLTNFEKKVL